MQKLILKIQHRIFNGADKWLSFLFSLKKHLKCAYIKRVMHAGCARLHAIDSYAYHVKIILNLERSYKAASRYRYYSTMMRTFVTRI